MGLSTTKRSHYRNALEESKRDFEFTANRKSICRRTINLHIKGSRNPDLGGAVERQNLAESDRGAGG